MTIKALVIGRGDWPEVRLPNTHTLTFKPHAGASPTFLPLDHYDFVFMHLGPGNPEASNAISFWTHNGWGNKIVGFSGGSIPTSFTKVAIPKLEGLAVRQDIVDLPWASVPADFSGDAQTLVSILNPERSEALVSLAILCQGYLAAFATGPGSNEESEVDEQIGAALSRMGWYSLHAKIKSGEIPAAPSLVHLSGQASEVRKSDWWLRVWNMSGSGNYTTSKWDSFVGKVERDCMTRGGRGLPADVEALLKEIKAGAAAQSIETIQPSTVARAYTAIADLFMR